MTPRMLARRIVKAASDTKALDIVVLDLRKLVNFTDYFIICSGTSDRQVHAIVDAVCDGLKERKRTPIGVEGEGAGQWVLVDFGDVIVHVFHQTVREHYRLESLWHDAPRLSL